MNAAWRLPFYATMLLSAAWSLLLICFRRYELLWFGGGVGHSGISALVILLPTTLLIGVGVASLQMLMRKKAGRPASWLRPLHYVLLVLAIALPLVLGVFSQ
jgi:hypothetical protein